VIDPVQERNHNGITDQRWRRQLERCLQLRRLRRHPKYVDISVERRRSRNVHLEITERNALDAEPARMSRKRPRPEQEHDIGAGASERTTDKTADAACTENCVSHTNDRKPGWQTR
jgi:hypothetical protein